MLLIAVVKAAVATACTIPSRPKLSVPPVIVILPVAVVEFEIMAESSVEGGENVGEQKKEESKLRSMLKTRLRLIRASHGRVWCLGSA